MAESKKYILDGYRFNDADSYEQAKRELNKISALKSGKNLMDEVELREVYDLLVESEEFVTPVGVGFLREAQRKLVKNPEQRKTMKAIPVSVTGGDEIYQEEIPSAEVKTVRENAENETADADKSLVIIDELKRKIRNFKIVTVFLAIMVLVPFGIVAYDKMFAADNAEQALLDEYAGWKEELTKKEQELEERERLFEEMANPDLNSNMDNSGESDGENQNSGG